MFFEFEWTFFLLGTLLTLVFLNFACWLTFKCRPVLLRTENERLSLDYFSRFEGDLKRYIPDWFDIKAEDWPEFVAEGNSAIARGGHVYDPFMEVRHPPSVGRFHNFHPDRFRFVREQGPWPIRRDALNIFFFGGSTTVNVGPDWTSIPSYLQEILNKRVAADRPIRVYNFGCGSYFSTQERILFQQLLLDGAAPDMVIFLDGVNDFYFFDGRPSIAGFFKHALDTHNQDNEQAKWSILAGRPKWRLLSEFVLSLPLCRAIDALGERLAKRSAKADEVLYRPIPVDPDSLLPAIDRYFDNKRQIEAISKEYGIGAVFVWQPTPAYKYDLRNHIALSRHYGLGGHERSGVGYGLMAQLLVSSPLANNFIWLADIQENEQQALYLDNMHYTSKFSQDIAGHIADALISRGLISSNESFVRERFDRVLATPAQADAVVRDGLNRIAGSALKDYQLAHLRAECVTERGPLETEPVIRLMASKNRSEHYAVLSWSAQESGLYTFSVYIRRDAKAAVRVQLHDDRGSAAIADYMMHSGVFSTIRVGQSSGLNFTVGQAMESWVRLALTANLPGSKGNVFLQLIKSDGATNFADPVPDVLIQGPMVEAGSAASSYKGPAKNEPIDGLPA